MEKILNIIDRKVNNNYNSFGDRMRKEIKTQRTKEKILKAGIREFGQNGYAGSSINAICATGINKGLIYHNYKDKDDLYLACVKRSMEEMATDIETQMKKGVTYNAARMHFFSSHEMEARIFLEIMVNPPQKLESKIKILRAPIDVLNRQQFGQLLAKHTLRKNVSEEMAYQWMEWMQTFYNMWFQRQENKNASFMDRMEQHEKGVAQCIDLMLYGIAQKKEE